MTSGTIVNPLIVEGQVHGGVVQGISQALFEEAVYDDNGTLITGSFVGCLVPSAPDLIDIITDYTVGLRRPMSSVQRESAKPAQSPPLRRSSMGFLDALRPLGVTDIEMPCTPMRVWKSIQGAKPMTDESATPGEAKPHFDSEGGQA